jgi:hypothetical protein
MSAVTILRRPHDKTCVPFQIIHNFAIECSDLFSASIVESNVSK